MRVIFLTRQAYLELWFGWRKAQTGVLSPVTQPHLSWTLLFCGMHFSMGLTALSLSSFVTGDKHWWSPENHSFHYEKKPNVSIIFVNSPFFLFSICFFSSAWITKKAIVKLLLVSRISLLTETMKETINLPDIDSLN